MMKKKRGYYFRVYLLRRRKLRYGGEDDVIRHRATAADIILELFSSVPSSGWPVVVKWRRAVQIRDRHLRIRQKPNARVEYIYLLHRVHRTRFLAAEYAVISTEHANQCTGKSHSCCAQRVSIEMSMICYCLGCGRIYDERWFTPRGRSNR